MTTINAQRPQKAQKFKRLMLGVTSERLSGGDWCCMMTVCPAALIGLPCPDHPFLRSRQVPPLRRFTFVPPMGSSAQVVRTVDSILLTVMPSWFIKVRVGPKAGWKNLTKIEGDGRGDARSLPEESDQSSEVSAHLSASNISTVPEAHGIRYCHELNLYPSITATVDGQTRYFLRRRSRV